MICDDKPQRHTVSMQKVALQIDERGDHKPVKEPINSTTRSIKFMRTGSVARAAWIPRVFVKKNLHDFIKFLR